MKKLFSIILIIATASIFIISPFAKSGINNEAETSLLTNTDLKINAKSALLMEANTGKILFSQNENEPLSPASVTKVMTLLLVVEAIKDEKISLTDTVTISQKASSMGGSQVFLEEGEKMSVEELLKCTVIASANDGAVALAEHVAGTESAFVSLMNKRANELGMENTSFENVTGLDDTTQNHYTSAKDIAIMSCELIKYDIVKKYSSLWQDTIRNGEFTLTNTNRLVRFYDGCNGLKTGSTDKAGFCISATAQRDGMQLVAVIMGAETRDSRNASAKALLDYGFSTYSLYKAENRVVDSCEIMRGTVDTAPMYVEEFCAIIPKGAGKKVDVVYDIPLSLTAPIKENETVGYVIYKIGEEEIGKARVYLSESVEPISFFDIFVRILKSIFIG